MKLQASIEGIGFWAPGLPDWAAAQRALNSNYPSQYKDERPTDPHAGLPANSAPTQRPAPSLLAANERRRAPDSVLVALHVAQAAVAQSGQDARSLASVFTSAHGDLPIIDALCTTLASNPLLLSPTRFHHSVHNAASGYWAMAAQCPARSTALSAYHHSFAAGLLEALVQVATEGQPVLLVGYDTQACGPLRSVNRSQGLLGVALVLSPLPTAHSLFTLTAQLQSSPQLALGRASHPAPQATAPLPQALGPVAHNALADALPLVMALAAERAFDLLMDFGSGTGTGSGIASQGDGDGHSHSHSNTRALHLQGRVTAAPSGMI